MLNTLLLKLTLWALRSKKLKGEQRSTVMAELLKNLNAFPTESVIKENPDGSIIIEGKQLTYEDAKLFIESCQLLNDNYARKIFHKQITFEAIKMGVHKGLSQELIDFSKACLWWGEQERTWVSKFLAD